MEKYLKITAQQRKVSFSIFEKYSSDVSKLWDGKFKYEVFSRFS